VRPAWQGLYHVKWQGVKSNFEAYQALYAEKLKGWVDQQNRLFAMRPLAQNMLALLTQRNKIGDMYVSFNVDVETIFDQVRLGAPKVVMRAC
jgi:hypothetical protein